MIKRLLIKHGAPTLAGMKAGNLFNCTYEDERSFDEEFESVKLHLNRKDICMEMLRKDCNSALILVYGKKALEERLKDEETFQLLWKYGYRSRNEKVCIRRLKKRCRCSEGFPHEIGVFLGYPIEDVKGFIANKGKCFKCCGCWKVYGDEHQALDMFRKYKECTDYYERQFADSQIDMKMLPIA